VRLIRSNCNNKSLDCLRANINGPETCIPVGISRSDLSAARSACAAELGLPPTTLSLVTLLQQAMAGDVDATLKWPRLNDRDVETRTALFRKVAPQLSRRAWRRGLRSNGSNRISDQQSNHRFGSRAALTFPSWDKSLSQEILLLAGGIIVQHAERLVSHCFIEAARLKGS
jgi:hypothetical protein